MGVERPTRFDSTSELVNLGGLAVAFVGVAITGFVVAGTLEADAGVPFVIAAVPLVVGFGFIK